MTICAGFKSLYGVVLSADTQETLGNTKIRVSKLVIKPPNGDPTDKVRMLFAGAGDGVFIDRIVEEMWKAAQRGIDFTMDAVSDRVEDSLIHWHSRIWEVYKGSNDKPQAELLYAIYVPHEIRLYKSYGPTVAEVSDYGFVGCGTELAEFLVGHMRQPTDSIEEDFAMSLYIINNAKEHVDDCGGETQIAALMLDGTIHTLREFDTKHLTEGIREIAQAVFYLLSISIDSGSTREDVSRTARGTAVDINRVRAKLKKAIPNTPRVSDELKDAVKVGFKKRGWPPSNDQQ